MKAKDQREMGGERKRKEKVGLSFMLEMFLPLEVMRLEQRTCLVGGERESERAREREKVDIILCCVQLIYYSVMGGL